MGGGYLGAGEVRGGLEVRVEGEQAVGVMAEAVVKVGEAWKEGATVEEKRLWQGGW